RECDHVRVQTIDHRTRLATRAGVRLFDRHALVMLLFPLLREAFVELAIQLARRVVADIEQRHPAGVLTATAPREQRQHAETSRNRSSSETVHSAAPSLLSLLGR